MKESKVHKIRVYNDNDRKKVIELWKTCKLVRPWNDPDKDLDRKNKIGKKLFLILELDNKIIGSIMGGYDGHRGVINYLAVEPTYRGNGFGKMLINAVENKLKKLGCPKINLLVRSDNIDVENFYKDINYHKQEDVFVFGKRLIADD